MVRHNLATVMGFEFTRTLRKRGFWIATLAIPVVIAIIFALSLTSNTSISDSADAQAEAEIAFAYTDATGMIPQELATAYGGHPATDPETAIGQVKAGDLDAYLAYPGDPAVKPIEVAGADRGCSTTAPTTRSPRRC
ncbi:hypothetical protein GCM10011374_38280 [Kocuria dechangensis]|uniref:ABC-2 type transport system permease protein n=1 Tax=Kocuria dechangensis TaxID=1176249 RepID=A0A917H8G5_9MICC|nr:hypothetical protein [Kocuria dechangensis]GGG70076.1 hypothetical protein GCM10011374_38280 [Kocuria dechangensis]